MYIYIYISLYIYIYISIYIYLYIYIYIYISIYIYIYIDTDMTHTHNHICICIQIHTHTHIYIYIYINVYVYIHIYIYIFIHIFVYINTHDWIYDQFTWFNCCPAAAESAELCAKATSMLHEEVPREVLPCFHVGWTWSIKHHQASSNQACHGKIREDMRICGKMWEGEAHFKLQGTCSGAFSETVRMASVRGSKLKFSFNAGSRAPGNCAAFGSLCPKGSK